MKQSGDKMQKFEYTITDKDGLHARPAGLLVQMAKTFPGHIYISANEKECEATRLMALMAMCIKCGTPVTVTVSGENEEAFTQELEEFFKANL